MKTKTVARFSLLIALALVLGYVELLIPVAPTIPGIKLGLGNTVLLYAVYMTSPWEAAVLMLCKVALSGFLFGGGFSSILYSLAGGVVSLLTMVTLARIPRIGVIGVSACGAIAHNIGQIAMASLLLGAGAVWAYFPILVLSGLVMGPVTGMIAQMVFTALQKNQADFSVRPRYFRESRKTDLLIILCMVMISGGAWLALSLHRITPGAVDANASGEQTGGSSGAAPESEKSQEEVSEYYLEVIQNSRLLYEIPMTEYGTYILENPYTGGINTFVLGEEEVHMEQASCPDKICISQGTITFSSYLPICCLPNALSMQVVSKEEIPQEFDLESQKYDEIRQD